MENVTRIESFTSFGQYRKHKNELKRLQNTICELRRSAEIKDL